ncbi:AAA family ATPase [Jeotgalicoccus aerolatus]|uniref:ATPase n=1 Tax=Jeotgalicoccus aerolatus TaxID=709510 RepID=A0ABS4HMB8_9STAP|nr:AAA family ATPase [Jeotgalicoccus aerolatus]MBP1951874.1 putative ATPase [Jeotgalicoccus aerolatus]
MKFFQKKVNQIPTTNSPSGIYLVRDNWNDYWKYQTMFDFYYVEKDEVFKHIGKIKIGRKGLSIANIEEGQSGHKMLELPDTFEQLSDEYFSLGQDVSYYENLKKVINNFEVLKELLKKIKDMALDFDIYEQNQHEDSMRNSITRDFSTLTIRGQFNRVITGQAKLTKYKFGYNIENADETLDFRVTPNTFPPSNVQVLIGRNGVGKSYLLQSMIKSIVRNENDKSYFVSEDEQSIDNMFASLIGVSFGSFDDQLPSSDKLSNNINYHYVGLQDTSDKASESEDDAKKNTSNNSVEKVEDRLNALATYFYESLENISANTDKVEQWYRALSTLERDSVFRELEIKELLRKTDNRNYPIQKEYIIQFYKKNLSAGHKIVLLIITKLTELVEEKSLVLIDEPENHLHPPLLSLLIRAISDLLTYRNGVAIIVTHSPIIVQEVPKDCTWILTRNGKYLSFDRPIIETFGENTGILNREIFRMELTDSSYYDLVKKMVLKKDSVEEVFEEFDNQLGSEARAMVRTLMYQKKKSEDKT